MSVTGDISLGAIHGQFIKNTSDLARHTIPKIQACYRIASAVHKWWKMANWGQKCSQGKWGAKWWSQWNIHDLDTCLASIKHCQNTGGCRWIGRQSIYLTNNVWMTTSDLKDKVVLLWRNSLYCPHSACLSHHSLDSMSFCRHTTKASLVTCYMCTGLPWHHRQFSSRCDHQICKGETTWETGQNDVCGKHCAYEWSQPATHCQISQPFWTRMYPFTRITLPRLLA